MWYHATIARVALSVVAVLLAVGGIGCVATPAMLDASGLQQSEDWWLPLMSPEAVDQVRQSERAMSEFGIPVDYGQWLDPDSLRDPRAAFLLLLNTELFAGPFVGIDGSASSQAIAFGTLMRQGDPRPAFEALLAGAHMPGRLYALAGLYLTDRRRFEEATPDYRGRPDSVWTQFGCTIAREPIGVVVAEVEGGRLPRYLRRVGR